MTLCRLPLSIVACGLLVQPGLSAPATVAVPRYEISLDDRNPLVARMSMQVPASAGTLMASPKTESVLLRGPSCGGRRLARSRPGVWHVPDGCDRVAWTATIRPIDATPFDIAAPPAVWLPAARLWLLTNSIPWLRLPQQRSASVQIRARLGRDTVRQTATLPPSEIPLAIVVGRPVRTFVANGFTLRGFGFLPSRKADRWQRRLASILGAWRRDLLPSDSATLPALNYVWLPPPVGAEPGLQASSNSGSILMQLVADPHDGDAGPKLKVGILMIGAHEGFHSLGAVRGGPAWVDESLATFFAFDAARDHLDPVSLDLARTFVNVRTERSLLNLQKAFDAGDGSAYASFYGKGARFWSAIERVLVVPGNRTGKLAALIRQTRGLEGIDWTDGQRIASYLNRFSNGRAAAVVRCYLIEDDCAAARNDDI